MKYLLTLFVSAALLSPIASAETVHIDMQLPALKSAQYKRPYVAVWLEQKGQRKAVHTVAVWHEDKKWLKDIRRWWRKAGRYGDVPDAVTGATRAPGQYQLTWDGKDTTGTELVGEYQLMLEASREHGDRTLLKQAILLGSGSQNYQIDAGTELGPVTIRIGG